jgi:hypothetical protein
MQMGEQTAPAIMATSRVVQPYLPVPTECCERCTGFGRERPRAEPLAPQGQFGCLNAGQADFCAGIQLDRIAIDNCGYTGALNRLGVLRRVRAAALGPSDMRPDTRPDNRTPRTVNPAKRAVSRRNPGAGVTFSVSNSVSHPVSHSGPHSGPCAAVSCVDFPVIPLRSCLGLFRR